MTVPPAVRLAAGREWQVPSRSGYALLHGGRGPVPLGRQGRGCAKLP